MAFGQKIISRGAQQVSFLVTVYLNYYLCIALASGWRSYTLDCFLECEILRKTIFDFELILLLWRYAYFTS